MRLRLDVLKLGLALVAMMNGELSHLRRAVERPNGAKARPPPGDNELAPAAIGLRAAKVLSSAPSSATISPAIRSASACCGVHWRARMLAGKGARSHGLVGAMGL